MVRTPRPAEPDNLRRRSTEWTRRWLQIRSGTMRGDWATRGAKQIIGEALRVMAHGKCVFCEGPLDAQSYLGIDHYVAKTRDPAVAFVWTNLLPACQMCNVAKGETDHRNELLKPDAEDPEQFFWVHPDTGKLEPHPLLDPTQRKRAEITIDLCDLQRPALCAMRIDALNEINRWIDRWSAYETATSSEQVRIHQEWMALSAPRHGFKLAIRLTLGLKDLPDFAEADRARFEGRES